jgi:hypothetical protein
VADVQQARNAAEEIYYNYYIDLYHFAEMVDTHVTGAAVEAQAVMNSVNTTVYADAHGSSVPNDHGLSIYYPRVEGDYLASYDSTAFASDTEWDEFLKRYYEGPACEGTATSCGIYPNCENCNDNDGCYAYGNGCEERDYYCISNEAGCGYTYSNRHTDGWVDTGKTDWVEVNECQEKERKEQEYRDYYCSGGACTSSVTGTQWVDTGTTRNKPDGTICGCTASNTLKRCYSGVCTDTGICNSSICGADAACDGKVPGDSCGGGICDYNCKCGGQAVGEDTIVVRNGRWYVDTDHNHLADETFYYGKATDIPLTGDVNQDGKYDIIVVRDGRWYVDTDHDLVANEIFYYGKATDIPLTGDVNQDGKDDTIVFRDGRWYVDTNHDQVANEVFYYGKATDIPLTGDVDQDGTDDIIVVRNGRWYVDTNQDHTADVIFYYGKATDIPLVGDVNQDGTDDVIVVRNGRWYVDTDQDHAADESFYYGKATDIPLVGDIG